MFNAVAPQRRHFLSGLLGLLGSSALPAKVSVGQTKRKLLLLESSVAGVQYYALPKRASRLAAGTPLTLRREPSNAHDTRAIEVLLTASGKKVGYVPRRHNKVIATLMDQGVQLTAQILAPSADHPDFEDFRSPKFSISLR